MMKNVGDHEKSVEAKGSWWGRAARRCGDEDQTPESFEYPSWPTATRHWLLGLSGIPVKKKLERTLQSLDIPGRLVTIGESIKFRLPEDKAGESFSLRGEGELWVTQWHPALCRCSSRCRKPRDSDVILYRMLCSGPPTDQPWPSRLTWEQETPVGTLQLRNQHTVVGEEGPVL